MSGTGVGKLLVHYLTLALEGAHVRIDGDVRTELDLIGEYLDQGDELLLRTDEFLRQSQQQNARIAAMYDRAITVLEQLERAERLLIERRLEHGRREPDGDEGAS